MKIAILTLPFHTNYGGILQAYALQTFLQRNGHDVLVINRNGNNKISPKLYLLRIGSVIKSFIRLVLLGKKEYVLMNPFSPLYHSKWSGYDILPFVKQNIKQTKEIRSTKALIDYFNKNQFDCYIVGSDQVWRPCYSPCITDFFLKDVLLDRKAIKLAYAASFGTDEWEFSDEETKECAVLSKLFDAVSVREKSGVKLCKEYLGIDAEHLLDPTMLLDKEDYINLFSKLKASKKTSKSLFCYILDHNPEADKMVSMLEEDEYIPYYASCGALSTKDNPRPYQLTVEEWLLGIYDAELILTDSFHACVFAIIFCKPFIVVGNKDRGNARFDSLLDMFHLQKRRIESCELFKHMCEELKGSSDIVNANNILNKYRQHSLAFFKRNKVL